jgi:hypothetical protein
MAIGLASLLLGTPAMADGPAGRWHAEFDTPVGRVKYVFDLTLAGAEIKGKAAFERPSQGQKGETELREGKLTGNEVFFVETLDIMGTAVRVEYKGTLNGDQIAFTRKVGDFGVQQFVAQRAKPQ